MTSDKPQPISTAPKDGRDILGCNGRRWFVCCWEDHKSQDGVGIWMTINGYCVHPTHWLPLPELPGEGKAE